MFIKKIAKTEAKDVQYVIDHFLLLSNHTLGPLVKK